LDGSLIKENKMNKTRKGFITTAVLLLLCLVFFSCENIPEGEKDNGKGGGNEYERTELDIKKFVYKSESNELSRLLGYVWKDSTDFRWIFRSDGTITFPDCCCALDQSFYIKGNIFISYFTGMIYDDDLEGIMGMSFYNGKITSFNMASDGLSFVRNGETYTRGEVYDEKSLGATSLKIINILLGTTWQNEDGDKYVFGSDSELQINSEQYGYLVYNKDLVIIGPLEEGKPIVIQKYLMNKTGDKFYLSYTEGGKVKYFTLAPYQVVE
jgi:hypothetical protein